MHCQRKENGMKKGQAGQRAPLWTDDEMAELGYGMKTAVLSMEAARECANCGDAYIRNRDWQRFCSLVCQQAWNAYQRRRALPRAPGQAKSLYPR